MPTNERPANWSEENAAAFQLVDVVAQYHLRAPYPSTVAPFLLTLARPAGGPALDLGCGTGEIARRLAPQVERVDAVDVSRPMLDLARTLPGGGDPSIYWIEARAEEAPLAGPYSLAVAGASLHWMDWDVVLPRFAEQLAPDAVLAIGVVIETPPPWVEELRAVIAQYSVIQNWQPVDLIAQLEQRGLYRNQGERTLEPEPYTRTVEEYIKGLQATSGLARERMGEDRARAFERDVCAVVARYVEDGVLRLSAAAEIKWGKPTPNDSTRRKGDAEPDR